MLKVENVNVYDLEESIIASGYAMRLEPANEEVYSSLKYWLSYGDLLPKFIKHLDMQNKDLGENNKESCKKCGSSHKVQRVKDYGFYCCKHAHELYRYGSIVDDVVYNILPDNTIEIEIKGDKNIVRKTLISAVDLPIVFGQNLSIDTRTGYLKVNGKNFQTILKDVLSINAEVLDHISKNTFDNRRENLRPSTIQENTTNSTYRNQEVTGVSYVHRCNKWRAYISPNNVQEHIGYFDTKEEAIKARLLKEKEIFGEFSPNIELFDSFGISKPTITHLENPDYKINVAIKEFNRVVKLVRAGNKDVSCHSNFLTGIRVSFDVTYPQYWTPEFQRYHFADIVTSSSKMHRLLKMDLDKACNKYVSKEAIQLMKENIRRYNQIAEGEWSEGCGATFHLRNDECLVTEDREEALYWAFMKCISDCPMGIQLFMRVSTNYKQLQTIYHQRKHHKLKEDWGAFIEFIESLPYAKELIIGEL